MVAYNKYEIFVEDLMDGHHDLDAGTDLLKVMLSDQAPNAATHELRSEAAEISGGNGYTSGGEDTTNTGSRSGGTYTVAGTKVVWTATGAVGPFQYVILYNDTPGAPLDPLIGWWDYGSSISLANGETFSVKFDGQEGAGDIFTLT